MTEPLRGGAGRRRTRKFEFELGQVAAIKGFCGVFGEIIAAFSDGCQNRWYTVLGHRNPTQESHGTWLETELRPLSKREKGKP